MEGRYRLLDKDGNVLHEGDATAPGRKLEATFAPALTDQAVRIDFNGEPGGWEGFDRRMRGDDWCNMHWGVDPLPDP